MISIGHQLGKGTYGTVYESTIEGYAEPLAIKRLFVEKQTDFAFSLREMDVMFKLKHTGILSLMLIHKSNRNTLWSPCKNPNLRDDDIAFVFSAAKGDLSHMRKHHKITEIIAKNIITQLLLALEYLHSNGYVHRDIKPLNILYFDNWEVKLCDFGVCKKYYRNDNHSHVGSPLFTAPETMMNIPVCDYSVDIWSLGCVIHNIMSGKYVPIMSYNMKSTLPYSSKAQIQDIIYGLPYEVSKDTLGDDLHADKLNYERKLTVEDFFKNYIKLADPDLFEDFLFNMLQFDCRHRKSAGELLEHEYLSKYSQEIALSRSKTEKSCMLTESCIPPRIGIKNRSRIRSIVINLYRDGNKYDWYRDKVLFSAINLFDRLFAAHSEMEELNEYNMLTYFKTCLYIIAKYYSSHTSCDLSYDNFPLDNLSPTSHQKAKMFEDCVLEIMKYNVYAVSPYDVLMDDIVPTESVTFSMLLFVLDGEHFELTPEAAYAKWNNNKRIYMKTARNYNVNNEVLSKVISKAK